MSGKNKIELEEQSIDFFYHRPLMISVSSTISICYGVFILMALPIMIYPYATGELDRNMMMTFFISANAVSSIVYIVIGFGIKKPRKSFYLSGIIISSFWIFLLPFFQLSMTIITIVLNGTILVSLLLNWKDLKKSESN